MLNLYKSNFFSLPILLLVMSLCAVWCIPHTIAVRYLTSLALLSLMIWNKSKILWFFRAQPTFLILVAYILIHILLISDNISLSFRSFTQEWLKFISYTLLGATLGLYFSKQSNKNIFFWLGTAFSTPLIIHIYLFFLESIKLGYLPYGYAGLSISHGDLGYTALQSSIFLSVYLFSGGKDNIKNLIAAALLFLCLLSPYLAQSRGGLIFAVFSILSIASFFYLRPQKNKSYFKIFITFSIPLIILIFSIKAASLAMPGKWQDMHNRVKIGLMGNPIAIMCHGTEEIYKELSDKGINTTPHLEEIISDVNLGTAARVTVARAGFELLLENPLGLYGSKDAYQIAISKKCSPNIPMSNTHNGWLDLTLALGVPGFIIFIALYFTYIKIGISALRNNELSTTIAGVGLFATSVIWLLRGFLDATSRDQMLEIQAFSLALLAGLTISPKANNS